MFDAIVTTLNSCVFALRSLYVGLHAYVCCFTKHSKDNLLVRFVLPNLLKYTCGKIHQVRMRFDKIIAEISWCNFALNADSNWIEYSAYAYKHLSDMQHRTTCRGICCLLHYLEIGINAYVTVASCFRHKQKNK